MKIHGNDKVGQVFITLNAGEYLKLAKDCLIKRTARKDKYYHDMAREELYSYVNHVYNNNGSKLIYIYPPCESEIGFLRKARNKQARDNKQQE